MELAWLLGSTSRRDLEGARWWRLAPPHQHARAMIELSRYAEQIARLTGIGKPAQERFPGFPPPKAATAHRGR